MKFRKKSIRARNAEAIDDMMKSQIRARRKTKIQTEFKKFKNFRELRPGELEDIVRQSNITKMRSNEAFKNLNIKFSSVKNKKSSKKKCTNKVYVKAHTRDCPTKRR